MGTRCLTIVKDADGNEIVNMYRQFDGYPEGHGLELAKFLANRDITAGTRMGTEHLKTANGMNCLAAMIVSNFKPADEAGGFYLYAPGKREVVEDYIYTVTLDEVGSEPIITVENVGWGDDENETIFVGPASTVYADICSEYGLNDDIESKANNVSFTREMNN